MGISDILGGKGVSVVISATDNFSRTFSAARMQMAAFKPAGLAIAAGMAAVGVGMAAVAASTLKTAIDFESAFTGVQKTVELTAEEFDVLNTSLKNMTKTVPKSYVELASIAEIAGQLGVEGVDNITKFTKTITDISESTNLTAENAATSFARIANVMGEPIANVDRMGAAVVDLGNNFATSETEIVEMSMRVMGAGKTIGMSTQDVFGMSAALSSLGIQSEMGGSAISRAMITMSKAVSNGADGFKQFSEKSGLSLDEINLLMTKSTPAAYQYLLNNTEMTTEEINRLLKDTTLEASSDLMNFATVSGLSADEFSKLWSTKPVEAMSKVIMGLKKTNEEGGNTFGVLEDLDLSAIRISDTMLRLAGSEGGITAAVEKSNQAWEENTALSEEANKRYDTLASQIQMTKNEFTLMALAIGEKLMPIVRDTLLPFIRDQLIPTMGRIFDKIVPIMRDDVIPLFEKYLVPAIGKLIDFTKSLKTSWDNLSPSMQTAIKLGLLATGAVLVLTAGLTLLGIAFGLLMSPILLIALAFGALVTLGYYLWKNWDIIKEEGIRIWNKIKENIVSAVQSLGDKFIWLKDSVLTPVWDTFKNIYGWLKNKFLGVIGSVIDKIKSVISLAREAGGGIASAAGKVLGSRQTGGYIPQTGLYNLHQGEYVVPKREVNTSGRNIIINIDNLNGFNAGDIAEGLQEELEKKISMG